MNLSLKFNTVSTPYHHSRIYVLFFLARSVTRKNLEDVVQDCPYVHLNMELLPKVKRTTVYVRSVT